MTHTEFVKMTNVALKEAVQTGSSNVKYDMYKFMAYLGKTYNVKFIADLDNDQSQYAVTSNSGHTFNIFTNDYSSLIKIELV